MKKVWKNDRELSIQEITEITELSKMIEKLK